jgi:hypothetical protein
LLFVLILGATTTGCKQPQLDYYLYLIDETGQLGYYGSLNLELIDYKAELPCSLSVTFSITDEKDKEVRSLPASFFHMERNGITVPKDAYQLLNYGDHTYELTYSPSCALNKYSFTIKTIVYGIQGSLTIQLNPGDFQLEMQPLSQYYEVQQGIQVVFTLRTLGGTPVVDLYDSHFKLWEYHDNAFQELEDKSFQVIFLGDGLFMLNYCSQFGLGDHYLQMEITIGNHQGEMRTTIDSSKVMQAYPWYWAGQLPEPRYNSAVAFYNGYLYVIAGQNEFDRKTSTVYYTTIDEETGRVNPWQETTSIPNSTYFNSVQVIKGYLYSFGGFMDVGNYYGPSQRIYFVKINSDGTLGTWQISENEIPIKIAVQATTHTDTHVYLVGAAISFYAPILPDGTLGEWKAGPDVSVASIGYPKMEVYQDRIYLVAGNSYHTLYADINPDGSLTDWQILTSKPVNLVEHEMVRIDNQLVFWGGRSQEDQSYTNVMYYATIQPDLSLNSWTLDDPIPRPIRLCAGFYFNNRIYSVGGEDINGEVLRNIYMASFDDTEGTFYQFVSCVP